MNKLFTYINGFKVYGFKSSNKLIEEIRKKPLILIAINAEKIYHGNRELKEISTNGIGYPDGIGAVLALHQKGLKNAIRIPGSELWLDIIADLRSNESIYLIGSTQSVIEAVVEKLMHDHPNLNIVGYSNGFLNENEIYNIELDLIQKKPNFVFVAQGSPRQEILMKRFYTKFKATYMGLGGSYDVYIGNIKRAPGFFRKNGLEWFYRLISQPSRIKRQKVLLPFLINLYRGKY